MIYYINITYIIYKYYIYYYNIKEIEGKLKYN